MQSDVTVQRSWQIAIILIGLTITVSGVFIAGIRVGDGLLEIVYAGEERFDAQTRYIDYKGTSFLLGTAIMLYGTGMTLFKAPLLSMKSLIFALVSLAYLGFWIALAWVID